MATLSITKGYEDASVFAEADMDTFKTSIETFFNTTKVNDDNIADASINASQKLIDGSISTAKINDLAVTTGKIKADNITSAKIAANALDSEHYVASSIDTEHIADSQITNAEIVNDAITTDKIADGAVTYGKLTETGQQSSSSISYQADPSSKTELGSVSITTKGRPVMIMLQPGTSGGLFGAARTSATGLDGQWSIERDTTEIARTQHVMNQDPTGGTIICVPGCFWAHVDFVSAGTYTYKIYVLAGPDSTECRLTGNLKVFEL